MLTNEDLLMERYEKIVDSNQRIYRFSSGYGLLLSDVAPVRNSHYSWSAIVIENITDGGLFNIAYETPFHSSVNIFQTDAEANAFIAKAKNLFTKEKTMKLVVEVERVGRIGV